MKIYPQLLKKSIYQLELLVGLGGLDLFFIYISIFIVAWIGQFKGGMWEAEYPGLIGYVLWKFIIDIFGVYASGFIHFTIFILLISGLE